MMRQKSGFRISQPG